MSSTGLPLVLGKPCNWIMTLVQVGVCRRYALEAIISVIIYLLLVVKFIFRAITAMVLESAITTRLEGRLICTCGIINGKMYS